MALSQTQVSELYVAIFGRASEGSGNTYWQSKSTMSSAATDMLATTAATTYFGSSLDSNQAFIEHIYLNTLGKTYTQDKAGIDYWVKELDTKGRGDVISTLIVAAQDTTNSGIAQDQFNNRVKVSNSMSDLIFDTPSDYATSTAFKAGGLVVTNEQKTVTTATNTIIDKTTHINFTADMANNLSMFILDSDLGDNSFAKGIDTLHKMTLNVDGTATDTEFRASFGSSTWVQNGESTTSSTWSIVDGKLVLNGIDGNETWNDTLTLMSQTATEMKFYDQMSETNTMGTSAASDDIIENESGFFTIKLTEPSPRTEEQMLDLGLVKEIFSGQVSFKNSKGVSVAVPDDAKVALTADRLYNEGRICIDINNDGSFSGFGYTVGDVFTSSSSIEYQIFHDTNNDGIWSQGENTFSGFGQTIDLTGVSTPVTVVI